jgi:two-component system sensor histidine kinase PilS (NtrC family)
VIQETLKMMQLRFDKRSIDTTLEFHYVETEAKARFEAYDKPGVNEKPFELGMDAAIHARISSKHLKQVLLNVYLNAMEAIEAVEAEKGVVHTTVEMNSDQGVEIHISDNGKGMDRDEVQRLFEPFYSRKRDGTGLGIFICDRLLKLYGASINFESAPGQGTVCTIRLQRGASI